MAVKIRLARAGSRNEPFYKIVVAPSRAPRDGQFLERVGSYAPLLASDSPYRLKIDEERVRYWLSVGAQPTERVALFLGRAGVIPMPAQKVRPTKSKPKKKAIERAKRDEAAAAA
jgi:small subunit ribosomal protein S16